MEDTEYQQYLSDQEQLLDTFYDETEEWLNARLDDLDGLIQQVIEETNTNAGNISQTRTDIMVIKWYTCHYESNLQIAIQNGHLCHVRRSVCDIIGGQPKTN